MYIQKMIFEWDENKNQRNIEKHGISFDEAISLFLHPAIRSVDKRFSYKETRYQLIGITNDLVAVSLICTIRGDRIRIISARPAERKERKDYDAYCNKTLKRHKANIKKKG
jgi:uncharacterized protein